MTCILGQWERDLSDPFLRRVWPRAEKVSFVHSRLARLAILGGSATFRENSGGYFDIFLLLSNERCTAIIGLPYLTSFRSITYATLLPSTQRGTCGTFRRARSAFTMYCTLVLCGGAVGRRVAIVANGRRPAGSSSLAPISQTSSSFSAVLLRPSQSSSCSYRVEFSPELNAPQRMLAHQVEVGCNRDQV